MALLAAYAFSEISDTDDLGAVENYIKAKEHN
jgi:hypothetical protein